eukprot:8523351-Pyramimonas_sp.AAC.1
MDYVSFQWIGRLARQAGTVFSAVLASVRDARGLGFRLQATKSDLLASSREAARAVEVKAA